MQNLGLILPISENMPAEYTGPKPLTDSRVLGNALSSLGIASLTSFRLRVSARMFSMVDDRMRLTELAKAGLIL